MTRDHEKYKATHRPLPPPLPLAGQKASQYFGCRTFDCLQNTALPQDLRSVLLDVTTSRRSLSKECAEKVAGAVLKWATAEGATHFCHWFQPLTGKTAEKHDAFLTLGSDREPLEKLSSAQLMQGEPDASSFPNGGARSTFEARGYTTWDLTSPLFILEGSGGKTLAIPTAFISYTGEALDIKTPLLRSEMRLSQAGKKFMEAIGHKDIRSVNSTCGPEQEYFLIDTAFYHSRPDLVMTGRTLFGDLPSKNQQLSDHYFGKIPERVMAFMQELDCELYQLGIPAKTRHNEVAPGQYEIAPLFDFTNRAADANQILMETLKRVAKKHHFTCLLHEKPFSGINGSGKHLNWSLATDKGINLLDPGQHPEESDRFLTLCTIVIEAVYRHSGLLRMAIASAGNDHRLGSHEAPPGIISVYTGDALAKILEAIEKGETFSSAGQKNMETGTYQLARLSRDNTDRNRTSPFAFTGNRFELRGCGSGAAIGFPLTILNGAVAEVLEEAADMIAGERKKGKSVKEVMRMTQKFFLKNSSSVIFNGDGYSKEWPLEAQKRGLKNLRSAPEALPELMDEKGTEFLHESGVMTKAELEANYNVLIDNYNTLQEIEGKTLVQMVDQYVFPAIFAYKETLLKTFSAQKEMGLSLDPEASIYKDLHHLSTTLYDKTQNLKAKLSHLPSDPSKCSLFIVSDLLPLCEEIAHSCNQIERMIPNHLWPLPTCFDMLFLR